MAISLDVSGLRLWRWVVTGSPDYRDLILPFGLFLVMAIVVLPLSPAILDVGLALSIVTAVLILMVALFLNKPVQFTSFPMLLLLTTLLRLALNIATTRLILSHGNEGILAAGHVVAAFGGFLIGDDVLIGLMLFSILLVVNFVVITKGSSRIAEVAARFSLDALPGKQMAIDAELSTGLIDEETARARRSGLERESTFFGAMDGAARFVRGDAIAALIITMINIGAGLTIATFRHHMSIGDAIDNFTRLTAGDGLVSQFPSLLVSTAAGIVVSRAGMDGSTNTIVLQQLASHPKPLAMSAAATGVLALLPGLPALPFLIIAFLLGGCAWLRHRSLHAGDAVTSVDVVTSEPPIAEALRMDPIRIELGQDLIFLAQGADARLSDQIRQLRRSIASELGFVLPAVRIQDDLQLGVRNYAIRIKEVIVARGDLHPSMLLAMNPQGGLPGLPGEATSEPAFGLPALWISPDFRKEAALHGCMIVEPSTVLVTHFAEVVRKHLADLLTYSETQKLLDGLPSEQHKLLHDLVPSQMSVGSVQRVLQHLLMERVSIRDLGTILEAVQEVCAGNARVLPVIVAHVRMRLSRQINDAQTGPGGYIPIVTLSAEWEAAFRDALVGPPEDQHLVMAPGKLQEFIQTTQRILESATASGDMAVLVTSSNIRSYIRAIMERVSPATTVLALTEICPDSRVRSVGIV